jgi:hypothetical protein
MRMRFVCVGARRRVPRSHSGPACSATGGQPGTGGGPRQGAARAGRVLQGIVLGVFNGVLQLVCAGVRLTECMLLFG